LGAVTLGMDLSALDNLGVTHDSTITSAEWKALADMKELRDLFETIQSFGKSMFGVKIPDAAFQLDPTSFDEIREFDLAGETLCVTIKEKRVVEVDFVANPDPKWVERRILETLASKRPTAADFEKIRPGTLLLQVVFTVGIPASEEKVTTVDGTVTVMKYRLSRRQRYEIEVKDDVVTRVRTQASY
jgi:hypothetical protein